MAEAITITTTTMAAAAAAAAATTSAAGSAKDFDSGLQGENQQQQLQFKEIGSERTDFLILDKEEFLRLHGLETVEEGQELPALALAENSTIKEPTSAVAGEEGEALHQASGQHVKDRQGEILLPPAGAEGGSNAAARDAKMDQEPPDKETPNKDGISAAISEATAAGPATIGLPEDMEEGPSEVGEVIDNSDAVLDTSANAGNVQDALEHQVTEIPDASNKDDASSDDSNDDNKDNDKSTYVDNHGDAEVLEEIDHGGSSDDLAPGKSSETAEEAATAGEDAQDVVTSPPPDDEEGEGKVGDSGLVEDEVEDDPVDDGIEAEEGKAAQEETAEGPEAADAPGADHVDAPEETEVPDLQEEEEAEETEDGGITIPVCNTTICREIGEYLGGNSGGRTDVSLCRRFAQWRELEWVEAPGFARRWDTITRVR